MIIYAYAIVDSNNEITVPINGLGGIGVYNISYRDIGIVVSEGEQIRPVRNPALRDTISNRVQDITQEHILKHEEVVERLMENFTVLPVRFSTTFSQKEEVLVMLKEYYQDFKENLKSLRNKVEFGIRVIWLAETIKNRIAKASKKFNAYATMPANSPGKSFAKEKFEKYKIDKEFAEEADRCIALLDDFFSRNACEKKLEKLKSDNLLLNAYYLVEKEKQGDFKEVFERAKNTPGDLKYLFSGPWPPYNFINLSKKPHCFKDVEDIDMVEK